MIWPIWLALTNILLDNEEADDERERDSATIYSVRCTNKLSSKSEYGKVSGDNEAS